MAVTATPALSNREVLRLTKGMATREKAEFVWIFRPDLRPRIEHGQIRVPSLTIGGHGHLLSEDGSECPCQARGRCWHIDAGEIAAVFWAGERLDGSLFHYWAFEDGRVVPRRQIDW